MATLNGFDRLARVYRLLEYGSLGRSLETVRRRYIPRLVASGVRHVLLVGDGDGRFLRALFDAVPDVHVRSVDSSAAMLSMARGRLTAAERSRVTFEHADIRGVSMDAAAYDAVVTLFVLDCFPSAEVSAIVDRLAPALRPGGWWVYGDFDIPERGWQRWFARATVAPLYWFFRWQTGITADELPSAEAIITSAGLRQVVARTSSFGRLRSVLYAASHHP